MFLYSLRLGWWNIALSPAATRARSNASDENYNRLCEYINDLLYTYGCDFLGLCEVSSTDVTEIRNRLNSDNFSIMDLTHSIGRTRYDMAVIYNTEKISVEYIGSQSRVMTANTVKGAQVVRIDSINDEKPIFVYLCHWASRLNGDGEARRIAAANLVYDNAQRYMRDNEYVVVMGDFNDNPYDKSLNECMRASRCHDAVRLYPLEYFYNPFWRTIVSEQKYTHTHSSSIFPSGTHKYRQFLGTVWHSYDQILMSGSFLNEGYWHLDETKTYIVQDRNLLNDYNETRHFIDHLPIICEITRP